MIARVWKGWTRLKDANKYEDLLKKNIFLELKKIKGCKGGYILRDDQKEETEFMVITFFNSIDSIKIFAGEDYKIPVFDPEAKKLLIKMEKFVKHYKIKKFLQLS